VAPRTEVEEFLAASWSELLGIKQIGIHDNFFTELGGHSLLATQLVSRIRQKFQIEFALRQFFESPTILGLAKVIEGSKARGDEFKDRPITRLSRDLYRKKVQTAGG
jgi:acyl carrier protein